MSVPLEVTIRPATTEDEDFLQKVFASTLPAGTSQEMVVHQYHDRRVSYSLKFPFAEEFIVLKGDVSVGSIITVRTPFEIRLVNIALLPEFCRSGIGSYILRTLIAEAKEKRLPFRLKVQQWNQAAARLYTRMGLRSTKIQDHYVEMEILPSFPSH